MIIEALRKTRGNISRAADKIGVTRSCLHLRINKEPEIKAVVDEYRERFLDDLEDVFQNKALQGDTTAGLFLLKQLGKNRGYSFEDNSVTQNITKGILDFVVNRSKNPVLDITPNA